MRTPPKALTRVVGAAGRSNIDDCVDPDRANEPIEGTINIASSGPLSGGPAAAAFAPVIAGVQAYIDYANENQLFAGYEISITYGDDQYDPALTPGVINDGLDGGAHLVSAVIGTPNNQSIRDTLNEECVPHLIAATGDPSLNDPAEYPWTLGGNLPYDIEAAAYAENVAEEFPDGATAAVFYVNNDAGLVFKEGFEEAAGEAGIEVVDEQTIEAAETAPPTAQVSSIAGNAPDVIIAFPLGAQCPAFLNELANAKAANEGWEPRVYLTNTCASPLILGALRGDRKRPVHVGVERCRRHHQPREPVVARRGRVLGLHREPGSAGHGSDERRRLDLRRGDGGDPASGGRIAGRVDAGLDHRGGAELRLQPVGGP